MIFFQKKFNQELLRGKYKSTYEMRKQSPFPIIMRLINYQVFELYCKHFSSSLSFSDLDLDLL